MQSRLEKEKRKKKLERIILLAGSLILLIGMGALLYQLPAVRSRLDWRVETARVFVRSLAQPIQPLPTAVYHPVSAAVQTSTSTITTTPILTRAQTTAATETPPAASSDVASLDATSPDAASPDAASPDAASPTAAESKTPTPTREIIPAQANLEAPPFEGQDWNNCGPVSLSMYLNYYGWEGDQYEIAGEVKPLRADRNVNIEELADYVYQNVWWLKGIYRVGGDIDLLRALIHAGFPVLVEETMKMEEEYWFDDDRWAGHYLLLTGYDDVRQVFTTQDSFIGPNRTVSYAELDANWQAFNRVYMLLYPPEQEETVRAILGSSWNPDQNRQNALKAAENETKTDPTNAFAWFNLGSNLLYFERYADAAAAYDKARELSLPQRMLRYQFGPFLAYFHTGRSEELLTLSEYALSVTPNSEEALLWKGWALYRLNRPAEALYFFQKALEYRSNYGDAVYAINFVQGQ